jgi:hypothetical protein
VWHGFLNPLYVAQKCTACAGDGCSPEARHLKDLWYGYAPFKPEDRGSIPFTEDDYLVRAFAERNVSNAPDFYGARSRAGADSAVLVEARRLAALFNSQWNHHLNQGDVDALVEHGRLMDFTHEWVAGAGWTPKIIPYTPSAREVNEWSINGFGHDGINQWIVCGAECKRHGWITACSTCGGDGALWPSKDAKTAYEAWEKLPPPAGEGWQMWETVSEGSPVTPVFPTEEELVWHLVVEQGHSERGARAFVKSGWAPSGVDVGNGFVSGIEGMHLLDEESERGWA